jgi:hypothetical protein
MGIAIAASAGRTNEFKKLNMNSLPFYNGSRYYKQEIFSNYWKMCME